MSAPAGSRAVATGEAQRNPWKSRSRIRPGGAEEGAHVSSARHRNSFAPPGLHQTGDFFLRVSLRFTRSYSRRPRRGRSLALGFGSRARPKVADEHRTVYTRYRPVDERRCLTEGVHLRPTGPAPLPSREVWARTRRHRSIEPRFALSAAPRSDSCQSATGRDGSWMILSRKRLRILCRKPKSASPRQSGISRASARIADSRISE